MLHSLLPIHIGDLIKRSKAVERCIMIKEIEKWLLESLFYFFNFAIHRSNATTTVEMSEYVKLKCLNEFKADYEVNASYCITKYDDVCSILWTEKIIFEIWRLIKVILLKFWIHDKITLFLFSFSSILFS